MLKNMLNAKNLEFNYLKDYIPHAYVSASHPLMRFSSISLSDLKQFPYRIGKKIYGYNSNQGRGNNAVGMD